DTEIHIERDEARAGSTPGIVRYVLAISLVLVVIAFTVIVMTGALNSDQNGDAQSSSQRAVAEQNATKK
ncbi:MAG: hypothetical protein EON55_27305, partial [Alphaproteobacteria bacterium]